MHDLIRLLKDTFDYDLDYEALLEAPKNPEHGDLALPVFQLARELKQNPAKIAQDMQAELQSLLPESIASVQAIGPFLNFTYDRRFQAEDLKAAQESGELFKASEPIKETVLLEWPSPNSNKPLHIGHARNMLMGKSLANALEKAGAKVIRVNLNNDRGIAICKSMVTYRRFADGATPESTGRKPDYFVGDYYLMYEAKLEEHPDLEDEAKAMLLKWEAGDEAVVKLWRQMNDWAFQGHHVTYERFGIEHDKTYFESDIYNDGKDTIRKALDEGIFSLDEKGNIICDFEEKGLGTKVLLRADGTSVYMTQDIALAEAKVEDFGACDHYVFVVGNEQAYHFQVLFEVLSLLGFGSTEKFHHFSYGMIEAPDGKMSSRRGNVIYADELIDELIEAGRQGLLEREKSQDLDKQELERRAEAIAMGALSFFILKFNPLANFVFSKEDALSFEGETGPYLMYTYARIQSVLKKTGGVDATAPKQLDAKEDALIRVLREYPSALYQAARNYKISALALYLITLAQSYNEFYHACKIAGSHNESFRAWLSQLTAEVLADGMRVLGVPVLEEM